MASTRHPYWKDIPDERWNDWRWQHTQRIRKLETLKEIFPEAVDQFDWEAMQEAASRFPLGVTPYYLSLVKTPSWSDPIWRQVVPSPDELISFDDAVDDPLAEERYMPVPGSRTVIRIGCFFIRIITAQCTVVTATVDERSAIPFRPRTEPS